MENAFDAWWSTLTDQEQKVIGVNNARFVWNEAARAFSKECKSQAEFALRANNPECSWRISVMAEKILRGVK